MSSGFTFGANKPNNPPTFPQSNYGTEHSPEALLSLLNSGSLPQSSTFTGTTGGGGFQLPSTATSNSFLTPSFNFNSPAPQSIIRPLNIGSPSTNVLTPQTQNVFGSPAVSTPNASSFFGTPKGSFNSPAFNSPAFNSPASHAPAGQLFGNAASITTSSSFPFSMASGTKTVAPLNSSTPKFNFNSPTAGTNMAFATSSAVPTLPSMGIPFGTSLASPSTGISFGTASLPQTTAVAFGTSATPNSGITFSSPPFSAPAGNLMFGTPSTAPTFGTSSTAPAFGTSSTAPPFGISSTAPAFGTSSTAPAFGTSSTAPAFGTSSTAPAFGASSTAPAFGAPSTAPAFRTTSAGPMFGTTTSGGAVNFGTSTTSALAMALANASTASKGITFGNTTTPSVGMTFGSPSTTGMSFGAPSAMPASSATFGITTTIPSTGLTFSTSSTPQSNVNLSTPTAGKLFSAIPTTSTSVIKCSSTPPKLFGASSANTTCVVTSTTTATLSFGATKLTASSTVPSSLFGNVKTMTAPITSVPTLSFAMSLPSTTATLSFSTPPTTSIPVTTTPIIATTTTTNSSFAFGQMLAVTTATSTGLGGVKLATTTAGLGLLGQPTVSTATATTSASIPAPQPNVGLGGITSTSAKQATASIVEQTETAPKDQPLPNELLQTVENFKKFVQGNKMYSSEIARFSVRDFKKVESEIDSVHNYTNELETDLYKNKAIAEKLKCDTAKCLEYVEIAQRTFDTPAGLQYDNTAPINYFMELTDNFEKEMYALKAHIENIDKCIRNTDPQDTLTSQDLALGMRRLHDTFVALAGRLQSVHNQVELHKEQYLNLQKQLFNDYTNVFEEKTKQKEQFDILDKIPYQPPTLNTGPTPFSALGNSQAQILVQNLAPSYPGTAMNAPVPSGFNMPSLSSIPLFGGNVSAAGSMFNTSSSFNLQKPPVGNKRGKQ